MSGSLDHTYKIKGSGKRKVMIERDMVEIEYIGK